MKPVIVIGHSALDRVYRISAFPTEPSKVRALEHIESGGGMAANAAVAMARLGAPVELWSRVGSDEPGHSIIGLLKSEGVGVDQVRIVNGARSSTSAILVDQRGERLIVGERDHAMSMDASWIPLARIDKAAAVLSDLRWFEATRLALQRARSAGVPTVIDADLGGGGHVEEFLPLTDYAIFSAPEIERLLPDMSDDERLVRILSLGPLHAGVTRGAGGYYWRNRSGGSGHQPSFHVTAVDTTGAGDAFHGAFTWALARGLPDAQCALVAAAVAALNCRRLGARGGLPKLQELEAFLAAEVYSGAP